MNRARDLLDKIRQHRPPPREYPPDLPVNATAMPSDYSRQFGHAPDVVQLRVKVEAAVAALANLRRAVDKERDELEGKLLHEIDAGDEELRDGFRGILAGDLTIRTAGVLALGLGIVLSATGSVLGSLRLEAGSVRYPGDDQIVYADIDLGSVSVFLSPIFGLAGVVLGAYLNRSFTLEAAREEREHASRQESPQPGGTSRRLHTLNQGDS